MLDYFQAGCADLDIRKKSPTRNPFALKTFSLWVEGIRSHTPIRKHQAFHRQTWGHCGRLPQHHVLLYSITSIPWALEGSSHPVERAHCHQVLHAAGSVLSPTPSLFHSWFSCWPLVLGTEKGQWLKKSSCSDKGGRAWDGI